MKADNIPAANVAVLKEWVNLTGGYLKELFGGRSAGLGVHEALADVNRVAGNVLRCKASRTII